MSERAGRDAFSRGLSFAAALGALLVVLVGCSFGAASPPAATPSATQASIGSVEAVDTPTSTGAQTVVAPTASIAAGGVSGVVTDTVSDLGALLNPPSVRVRDGGPSGVVGGKMLWTFGDTILTHQDEKGQSGITNSAAIASLDNPFTITATLDATGAPVQLIEYTPEETQYNQERGNKGDDRYALWPASVVGLADGSGLVFFSKLVVKPGAMNFNSVGVGAARIDAGQSTARREAGLLFEEPGPLFREGAVLVEGRLYLYACEMDSPLDSSCKVARAPIEQATQRQAYRFWDGKAWVEDVQKAVGVLRGPTSGASVSWNEHLGAFLAVYSGILSSDILARTASQPEGPWSAPTKLFTGQAPAKDAWNYTGLEHPELAEDGGQTLYISYARPLGGFEGEIRLVRVKLR